MWTIIDTFYVTPEVAGTKPFGLVVFVRGRPTAEAPRTIAGTLVVNDAQTFEIKGAFYEYDDVSSIVLDAPATTKIRNGSMATLGAH